MPNASDVAARKYDTPIAIPAERTDHTLKYSKHAKEIFEHLTFHRICFAEDFHRFEPTKFKTSRLARKHLESIAVEGDIDVLEFADQQKPKIFVINDDGFTSASKYLKHVPDTIPARKADSKGSHVLHEALISEFASRRHSFFSTHPEYRRVWKERFGFKAIPSFEDLVPDYCDAFKSPNGFVIDFAEIFSGEKSITQVKRKLKEYDAWRRSAEADVFFRRSFKYWGAKTTTPAFRLLIVAHNRELIGTDSSWEREILGATMDLHPHLQRRIWTTTNTRIKKEDNLDAPIWHNATHLVEHRAAYRDLPKRKRFAFLSKILADGDMYPLFSFTP